MKYYAVRVGRTPGVFNSWADCQKSVSGFSGAVFKSFSTMKEATEFVSGTLSASDECPVIACPQFPHALQPHSNAKCNVFYTDGSFAGGKAGAAAVDLAKKCVYSVKVNGEQSNNRAELTAILLALQRSEGEIEIYSDSEYCINVLTGRYKHHTNFDLINLIFEAMKNRKIHFRHVAAHIGITYNEMADKYASEAWQYEVVHVDSIV